MLENTNNTILGLSVNRDYFNSALLNTLTCTLSQGTIFHLTYVTAYRKPYMVPGNIRTIFLTIMLLASFNNTVILLLQACYFMGYFSEGAMSLKLSNFFQAFSNLTYYLIFTAPLFITIWRYYNIIMIKKLNTGKAVILYMVIILPALCVFIDNIFLSKKFAISEPFTIRFDVSLEISKAIQKYYQTISIIFLILFSCLLIYTLNKIHQTLKTSKSLEICSIEIWITIAYLYHAIIPYIHWILTTILIYLTETEKIEIHRNIWIGKEILIGLFVILFPYTFVLFLKPYRKMILEKFNFYKEPDTLTGYEA
uniref:Serpentine receptor class gamma n=1 Tax=Strongyloides venezuelensis TaxID=75913 RepID=A0A0K0F2W6_STRVS